jgi:hypothetical protein
MVAALLGLGSVSAVTAAAVTRYNPSLAFGYARTGDVTFFGTGASDDSWNAVVNLPWTRQGDTAQTALGYSGRYTSYKTFTSLNDLAHSAYASHSRQLGPRTNFRISARASRSQDQGNPFEPNFGNTFLSRRTVRNLASFGIGLDRAISRRWRWSVGANANWARFDEIEDFDAGPVGPGVENGQTYTITTGMSRSISERSSLGGSYRFGIIEKEDSPDERGHVLTVDFSRKVKTKGTFGFSIGGYQRSRIGIEDDSGYRNSGVFASANLGFGDDLEVGPFQFRFNLGGGPSMGGGLSGTSTNWYAGVTVTESNYRATTKWRWSIAARYSYRIPTDRDLADTATFSMGGSVERQFVRQLAARVAYRWVEQQQQDDSFAATGSFNVIVAGLVWYPLGGTRVVGGR